MEVMNYQHTARVRTRPGVAPLAHTPSRRHVARTVHVTQRRGLQHTRTSNGCPKASVFDEPIEARAPVAPASELINDGVYLQEQWGQGVPTWRYALQQQYWLGNGLIPQTACL